MREDINVLLENYPDIQFYKADGFDDAILGISESNIPVFIYSIPKCIEILINDGMTDEEAVEYFYFNVIGSYFGDKTPIWCNDFQ